MTTNVLQIVLREVMIQWRVPELCWTYGRADEPVTHELHKIFYVDIHSTE